MPAFPPDNNAIYIAVHSQGIKFVFVCVDTCRYVRACVCVSVHARMRGGLFLSLCFHVCLRVCE